MAKTVNSVAQEIQKVELTIKNVRKDLKSTKKRVADCKKSLRKEKQLKKELTSQLSKTTAERDRISAEYKIMCAKIAEYQKFCQELQTLETTERNTLIQQAEKLLFTTVKNIETVEQTEAVSE